MDSNRGLVELFSGDFVHTVNLLVGSPFWNDVISHLADHMFQKG